MLNNKTRVTGVFTKPLNFQPSGEEATLKWNQCRRRRRRRQRRFSIDAFRASSIQKVTLQMFSLVLKITRKVDQPNDSHEALHAVSLVSKCELYTHID